MNQSSLFPSRSHDSHRMHSNSRQALATERKKLGHRAQQILNWLDHYGPATDRQVKDGLELADMNSVRPRITELIGAGLVEEIRNVRCEVTGKQVRVVAVKGNHQ
ncbi:MAG: hypothetical protein MI741_21730 [Rhodospirillales bacterium]|nr:hypothetical protein [Rhodospirillales bacterium]